MHAGLGEELGDEGGFAFDIGVDVVGELLGELFFEVAIGLGGLGVGAEVVSEEEVVGEAFGAGEAEIEVMFEPGDVGVGGVVGEGFTAGDAEVAAMLVADGGEALDGLLDEGGGGDDDVDV